MNQLYHLQISAMLLNRGLIPSKFSMFSFSFFPNPALPMFSLTTLLDKISADKIFGTKLKFRQFCPMKFCPIR
jgi:hypothetical protein